MSDIAVISRVSSGAIDGRLRILRVRQRLFRSFHEALIKHHGDLLKAVQADDGCLKAEAQAVLAGALIELRNHYDLLDFETDLELEYSLARKKSHERRRKAIALTYIIPNPFNLLYNVVSVLSAALEAGSCVIVELENTTQKTPVLLRRIILESLDRDAFGVVSSRAPTKILAQCVVIDQKPMSHNNISAQRVISTPEYRSVAVVDRTGDTNLAAKEIVASRLIFGGSSSYAVDLVLVNEFVAKGFQEAVSREMAKPGWEGQRTTGQLCESRRPNIVESTEAALFDEQVKSGKVTFVEGDSSKGAVQILDRHGESLIRSTHWPMLTVN
ncbi:hypothetical protein Daus18300_014069 [Diaporthe australafricana]|uniref:Aldehyde dehydrogenase domain-containing protein n=1 Tax=Diaporthe australafricana TaxID=127596 RepID=A0ABR3VWM6_9PEZI